MLGTAIADHPTLGGGVGGRSHGGIVLPETYRMPLVATSSALYDARAEVRCEEMDPTERPKWHLPFKNRD